MEAFLKQLKYSGKAATKNGYFGLRDGQKHRISRAR